MISEAVVLAGGVGTRLREYTKDKPKWMVKIFDRPLIFYPVKTLKSVGVRKFVVVVSEKWRDEMEVYLKSLNIEFITVPNDAVEKENGYSFFLSKNYVSSEYFFLTMSDHIYSVEMVKALLKHNAGKDDVLICGDSDPRYINVAEATKILTDQEKRVLIIGKGLDNFTHIDTGLVLVRQKLFDVAEMLNSEKEAFSFSDIINRAIKLNYAIRVVDVAGGMWTEIDTVQDLMEAFEGKRRNVVEIVLKELGVKIV